MNPSTRMKMTDFYSAHVAENSITRRLTQKMAKATIRKAIPKARATRLTLTRKMMPSSFV